MAELKRHRMTEQIYKVVKLMLKGGATAEDIREQYPLSKETLRRIKRTENYAEYVEMQRVYSERSAANLAKREEHPQETPKTPELPNQISIDDLKIPVSKQEYERFERIIEAVAAQTKVLELLSKNVAFIVSELTGKGAQ